MAQISGRDEEGKTARSGEGELAVPVCGGGIQPVENPAASSGPSVVASVVGSDARRSGADRGLARTTKRSPDRDRKCSDAADWPTRRLIQQVPKGARYN